MDLLVGLGVSGSVAFLLVAGAKLLRAPRVELGERGILDRSLGLGWIRWDEIEGVYQRRALDRENLFLRLRLTDRIRRRLGRRRAQPGRRSLDVCLDLAGTNLSLFEVVQEILAHAETPPRPIPQ